MNKIIFVVSSDKIHFYIWNCIQFILKEIKGVQIEIYIEKRAQKNNFTFSKFINYLDKKFSNYRNNSLEILDLDSLVADNKSITIVQNAHDLSLSDWIIFEKKSDCCKDFSDYSRNGFLSLDICVNSTIHYILKKSNVQLNILFHDKFSDNWAIILQQNFKNEIGFYNNTNKILFNFSIYLIKVLKTYSQLDPKNLLPIIENHDQKPSLLKSVIYYSSLITIILKRRFKNKKLNWKIGIYENDKLHFIPQPKKSFWADPFVIKKDDQIVVYFEELKQDDLGQITCVVLDESYHIKEKKVVIDKPYHFSFPNVFWYQDNYYMIPESSQGNNLELYCCSKFPFEWDFKINLIKDVKLIDASWVYHDNLYWIFANKIETFEYDNNERLYLYYSENLLSDDWTPHPQNPIITNAGLARNAGNIFESNGKIIRPSQNCTNGYGNNLVLNEIKILTTIEYNEEKSSEIFPPKGFLGMHTYNQSDDVKVVDFLVKE